MSMCVWPLSTSCFSAILGSNPCSTNRQDCRFGRAKRARRARVQGWTRVNPTLSAKQPCPQPRLCRYPRRAQEDNQDLCWCLRAFFSFSIRTGVSSGAKIS